MTDKIVFETLVGNIKALVFQRNFNGTWLHTLSVFPCFEPDRFWTNDNSFLPSDIPDAMEAFAIASSWLRKNTLERLNR